MISYAQNGEDVVLRRALADRENGFYIDVGACHPVEDSVTLHFYERGWCGLNVEPDNVLLTLLKQARPRDTNLCAAIGRERGRVVFHPTATRGHGTLSPELASGKEGRPPERVPQMPLSDVIDCYGPDDGELDFLKIDVEGWEVEVLASADWTRHRPRVVLVEAVNDAGEPTHTTWEPGLLNAGYRFALFDGLNRFYCREEDAERLLPRLGAPANVLDNWLRASEAQAHEAAARNQAEKAIEEQHAAEQARLHDETITTQARLHDEAITTQARLHDEAITTQARLHEEATTAARDRAVSAEARAEALGADAEEARANKASAERRAEVMSLDLERIREELLSAKEHCDVLAVQVTRSQAAAAAALRREEEAETKMAGLEMSGRVAEEEMNRLRRDHAAVKALLANVEASHAGFESSLAGAQAALAITRASTSWRITAPIRWLGDLVSGQRRGR
jgi:FkbM family methyltransferase